MDNILIFDNKEYTISKSCSVIINSPSLNIKYDFSDGDYKVLFFNNSNQDCLINEKGQITNSNVSIAYIQLDRFDLKQNTEIVVNSNCSLEINSTYLGIKNKQIIYNLINNEPDSKVSIRNNVVCLNDSSFSLDCIGTIVKGAKRSSCHQINHCFTSGFPVNARVLPILNIDEDDVEASHSLASGTIDQEMMFYMNSRGLNKSSVLNLILKSYLVPSEHFFDEYLEGQKIRDMLIQKVDDLCLM